MLFTQPTFLLLLLPLACLLFYSTSSLFGRTAGLAVLVAASLLFYLPWGAFYFALLITSISVNFAAACILLKTPDRRLVFRRYVLILAQIYNFGTLAWFKYRFVFSALEPGSSGYSLVDLAIPIGISFYTFQQAIFLVDAFHRDESVVKYLGPMISLKEKLHGYLYHAFFTSFFPHLVIGPIVYLREFQPQVQSDAFGRCRRRNLEVGLMLIAMGLFKKIVLADNIALVANSIFGRAEAHEAIPMVLAWAGASAYCLQLYFDFSGYSDMAVGTARMLGITFPYNFFSPFKAVGIIDFYRRWHITLTRVIARFMYTPLSVAGARFAARSSWQGLPARVISQWLPLLLNFEMIALWHGARATLLLFGVIHGLWYVTEVEMRASKIFRAWRRRTSDTLRGVIGRAIFLVLMIPCFALFRSKDVQSFLHLFRQMFTGTVSLSATLQFFRAERVAQVLSPGFVITGVLVAAAILVTAALLPNSIELLRRYRPGIKTYESETYVPQPLRFAWRPNWRWSLFMAGLFAISLYFIGRHTAFLYMGY